MAKQGDLAAQGASNIASGKAKRHGRAFHTATWQGRRHEKVFRTATWQGRRHDKAQET